MKNASQVGRERAAGSKGALPDFLIVGTQRAGTTLFYEALCRHPCVARARRKEVHYFDRDHAEGEEHYRSFFPLTRERAVTGEATPYYLYHPDAPERTAALVPDARIIVLLRNPVDRAYSHWRLQVGRGIEPLPFEEAIEAEEERLRGTHPEDHDHRAFSYLSRGIYAPQVARWRETFGDGAMLVLKSEKFFRKPGITLRRAHGHIGVEPRPTRMSGWRDGARVKNSADGPAMDPETKLKLGRFFAPHNKELYGILGEDLDW